MKTQSTKQGFKEAMALQSQRDGLRCELQSMSRFSQFGAAWEEKTQLLKRLDKLFFLQCEMSGLELSKFGRLL